MDELIGLRVGGERCPFDNGTSSEFDAGGAYMTPLAKEKTSALAPNGWQHEDSAVWQDSHGVGDHKIRFS